MEAREGIAGIFREKERDPFYRIILKPAELMPTLGIGKVIDGRIALEGSVVFSPLPVSLYVIYFTHFILSLIYESK